MGYVFRELKLVVRPLLQSPGFTATAILMLALGIGATTAIFSIVEGVLLRPLPFGDSDRLVVVSDILQGAEMSSNGEAGVTVPDILNYERDSHSFTGFGGYTGSGYELSGIGDPAIVNVARVTGGTFPTLNVQPLLGRVFTQVEDDGHQQVAVLSYLTWQSRFHGDAGILGKTILLERKPYVVIGVMPRGFEFPLVPGRLNRTELWIPMTFHAQELEPASAALWAYHLVGRLKPGISITQAEADAQHVAADTMRNYPSFMAGFRIRPVVRPLREETVEDARPLLRTLFLAVVVVLLIACANLAGLLLVRSIRRRREIAVRIALGANARTLLGQAVLESLVLSVTGGILGLVLAAAVLEVGAKLIPDTLPRINEIGLDWEVAIFALALSILTGVLCALAPAFAAIRTNVNETLKEGGRTGSAGGHARLRSSLVVAEIAISLVLVAASGLLLRSFEKMHEVSLGFAAEHTLAGQYELPHSQYPDQAAIDQFTHELLRRLQGIPGVINAGFTSRLPASGTTGNQAFVAEGYVASRDQGMDLASSMIIEGDYFQAMGIPLLRGRFLTADDRANAPLAVVVSHTLAKQSWPGQDPIGKRLRFGTQSIQSPWSTVVGEVPDVAEGSPDHPAKQQYYMPIDQVEEMAGSIASPADVNGDSGFVVIRTAMDPTQMENTLRSTLRSIDPQLALTQVQTMEQTLSDSEAPRRFNTVLISAFAAVALLLAVLGIYSVIAFSVAHRKQEMAIRMALGSQRAGILRLILYSGARLAAIGCGIGLVGAMVASYLLRSMLFGVSEFDPIVLAMAALIVLVLTLGASFVPAYRASSIDPMQSLR